jgi:hypothetical protein
LRATAIGSNNFVEGIVDEARKINQFFRGAAHRMPFLN